MSSVVSLNSSRKVIPMVMVASGAESLSPVFATALWGQFRYWARGWAVMGIFDAVDVERVIG
ncbi:hypothetical protein DPMN_029411 [Dreissena polymorpha]|uniref:Uncharacterized protein n=1 Tax=Dreissena polymorpha TaxID=45954 RepID=A0A9D4LZ06_DREPO|nr:hypothetical protein DPMN_029411 [Dreissena polymorpha]